MIRKVSFTALALLSCSAAAGAAAFDGRIRSVAYDPNEIVRIIGKAGIQSTIEFRADEQIENVAVGDSSTWQITPNRRASLLFVKPLTARSRTNMTVVTDKRTYMFDLVAGDKWTAPLYALKFSYPHEKAPEPSSTPVQQAAVTPPVSEPATLAADKLHFDWVTKGNGKLLPARVFDDGTSLYMAWSRETPLPAILTMSEDRKEGPVNYRMSGEYIVVSPVPANLVLRYGGKSAALWPSRRITPVQNRAPPPQTSRMAAAAAVQPPQAQSQVGQATPTQSRPAPVADTSVKLADMTSLFSDKLTDGRHDH